MNKISFRLAYIAVLSLWLAIPAAAQLSGIRYTVAPRADYVLYDGNAALKNLTTLSGRVGFGFGEYLELSAVGRYSPAAQTDFAGFSDLGDPAVFLFDRLRTRDTKLIQYGADLKVNFGRGRAVPYASIGTGVLSLSPDGLDRSETIYLGGSVGLLYRWQDRITFTLEAQRHGWRQNASVLLSDGDLTSVALAREDFNTIGVGYYAIGAGVSFDLGGRSRGTLTELDRAMSQQFGRGFSAVRLEVEPFAGQVKFAQELGYDESQRMTGVSAGVDLGPYLGLRGFYWRGLTDEGSLAFEDLQAYGGELKLRFGSPARRFRPALTLGGGYLDARGDYGVEGAEDQPFAMAGLGTSVSAGRYLSVHGGVKTLLTSTESPDAIASPTSVNSSLMYYGGVTFELGRSGIRAQRDSPVASAQSTIDPELAALRAELERQRQLVEELTAASAAASATSRAPDTMAVVRPGMNGDFATVADSPVLSDTTSAAQKLVTEGAESAPAAKAVALEKRRDWITVPVPDEGEIYIRFGAAAQTQDAVYYLDPATGELRPALTAQAAQPARVVEQTSDSTTVMGLTAQDVRRIVAETTRQAPARTDSTAATAPSVDLAAFEARLEARFNELDRRLTERSQAEAETQAPARPAAGNGIPATPNGTEAASSESTPSLALDSVTPLTGYNLNSPRTFLLGGRVEMARPGSAYSVLADFIMGFGGRTTLYAGVNAVVDFAIPKTGGAELYLGPGVGFLSDGDSQLVLNTLLGARYPLRNGKVIGEFQTQDLFNNNRVLVGYRFAF